VALQQRVEAAGGNLVGGHQRQRLGQLRRLGQPVGDLAAQQRARDNDARRILQDELQREEQRLAELRKEYADGQPERRGDERNYQKYLDRVASLKAQIERKEEDIAAIRRELNKVSPP
jgi:chromosome segregation ATPase